MRLLLEPRATNDGITHLQIYKEAHPLYICPVLMQQPTYGLSAKELELRPSCSGCYVLWKLVDAYFKYQPRLDLYRMTPNSLEFVALSGEDKKMVLSHRRDFQEFEKNWRSLWAKYLDPPPADYYTLKFEKGE